MYFKSFSKTSITESVLERVGRRRACANPNRGIQRPLFMVGPRARRFHAEAVASGSRIFKRFTNIAVFKLHSNPAFPAGFPKLGSGRLRRSARDDGGRHVWLSVWGFSLEPGRIGNKLVYQKNHERHLPAPGIAR